MRLDHTKEDEDEPETSPHREGNRPRPVGKKRPKTGEPASVPQGDGKVWNRVGFGGRGSLFAAGELLDPLRQIQVQHVDADRALACIVSLAAQAFHQRLGKCSIPPSLIFQRILLAGGGGKDHGTILRAGQFVHHGVDVRDTPPGAHDAAGMTGIHEKQRLASDGGQGVLDVGEHHAGPHQLVGIGIRRQKVIDAVGIIHAVAREKQHRHVLTRGLLPQPIQAIENIVFRRLPVGEDLRRHVSIQPALLAVQHGPEILRVLGGKSQGQIFVLVLADSDRQNIESGLDNEGIRLSRPLA
jgi:hypothetical protein